MNKKCAAVILASEESVSMKSTRSTFMLNLLSKPIISWVLNSVKQSGVEDISVVVSDDDTTVMPFVKEEGCDVCIKQKSYIASKEFVKKHMGEYILVVRGDTPLMDAITLRTALLEHERAGNDVTVICANADIPFGYSRIVRNENGAFVSVVEEKNADRDIKKIKEIASGAYWFNAEELVKGITECEKQDNHNIENIIAEIIKLGNKVGTYAADSQNVVLKACDRKQLYELNQTARINELLKHLEAGVDIPCFDSVMIEPGVEIGIDTVILPGTILRGKVKIGKKCKNI